MNLPVPVKRMVSRARNFVVVKVTASKHNLNGNNTHKNCDILYFIFRCWYSRISIIRGPLERSTIDLFMDSDTFMKDTVDIPVCFASNNHLLISGVINNH